MINVKKINTCFECKGKAKLLYVYIDTSYADKNFVLGELVKEYICNCGYITKYEETIKYEY